MACRSYPAASSAAEREVESGVGVSGPGSVVVVIPAKDRGHVIARALRSVLAQTSPPDEIIVVDDGSSDDTASVARALGVRVLEHAEPRGSGAARNTAIMASGAEWVAFLDSDDEWRPRHLEYLRSHATGRVLLSSSAVDSNGRGRGNSSTEPIELTPRRCFVPENPVVTSGVLARRETIIEAGCFGDFRRAQDVDLWARIVERGSGLVLPEPTVIYHVPPGVPEQSGAARNLAGLTEVVSSLADRPWMTSSLRNGIESRVRWDHARRALRDRDLAGAGRHASWIAGHPTTWPNLLQLVAMRRRARRPELRRVLDEHVAATADDSAA